MEDEITNLRLTDEEEDAFWDDPKASNYDIQSCLLETCLTDSVVYFSSPRNTMAYLWHPIKGIVITDLDQILLIPTSQGFAAINWGISFIIKIGTKDGIRSSSIGDNVTGLMDLWSNKESNPIHTDERKNIKGL
ncbi:hypothetical protein J1N35_035307 [Gossypium stocksii]|uniref:Uncharacterized protein n=1 Tax=Gossypium stocksii TaxID=47602 RepID=A0A9D3UTR3_9ROSI|nr:hypothetical protein J1N35_035307 [Gossypium stocksii]